MKNNPIPRDFSGNILKLAIAVRDHSSFGKNGWKIFQELSRLVASCVMLDCARQELLGSRVQLFDDVYDSMCFEALETFCNQYSPCSFSNRFGTCSNFKSGHNPKGHQNSGGKIIAAGEYQSTFDVDIHGELWIDEIRQSLASLQDRVHNKSDGRSLSELEATGVVHEEIMCDLYQNLGPVYKFVSHSTCFSCLRELPEHPLPCGHVLCSPCINAYGQKTSKTDIQLNYCPLHRWDTAYFPWKIRIKPLHAGTRILSLDGGGVRGIVELEVLKAIETALGGELPIQAFFDLIVGTSTGGIIALGLGVQNWTVDQCIEKFTDLCKNAFMPRRLKNIPILGKLEMANHRSIYRTKPFEDCLQECFEDRPLFGGLGSQEGYMVKVAVTSTTLLDQHAIVFGNYNRPETHEYSSYCFERHDKPLLEMKTWEAARATSAAPPYFKTFIKNETKCGYLDGALYHNNPVTVAHHERKAIWQDVNRQQPDIFLSLGTGHNGHSKSEATATSSIFRKKGQNADAPPEASHISLKRYHTFTGQLWSTVSSRFDSILNCNRIWDNFRMDVMGAYSPERRRYIRLNPDLRFKVPALDDIAQLSNLQKATKKAVVQPSVSAKIREVAHRLLASTFFFEKIEASTKQSKYGFECKGLICCRFQNGSIEMKALGQELRRCWIGDFEPYFMVQEDRRLETIQKVPIARHVLEEMILRGRFSTDRIHIIVSNQLSSTTISLCLQESCYPASADANLPISGFPRTLMAEDVPQKLPHRSARSSGSFTKRPHRRRRNTPRKTTSSSDQADGDSSAPTSLRRVKSQSNLRRNPDEAPTAPENPAGFGEWMMKRRKSTDWTELPGGARENVFEMPDTSLYRASSG
ncbi:hypothetical protein PVAG01_06670 [Phlyctema vagabunda]|uniref:FabD/lysophospholipase-like protein n=1 Tax=Phlyctema vagabunda TaxID=108571 RepID=A0ABR4PGT2_9HELO